MISELGKGEEHVQRKTHRGGDHRGAEAGGGGTEGGGCGAGSGGIEAHDLRVEGEIRWDGGERGAGSKTVAGGERAIEKTGGRSEFGQGRVAVGDPKKRMGPAGRNGGLGQVRPESVSRGGRACGLME